MDSSESGRDGANEKTISTRSMEIIVAGLFIVLALVVMWDSYRLGIGWASDGPEAGYFPFYVALIMFLSSAVTFVTNIISGTHDWSNFVERSQLTLVLKVLVPTIIYVVLIGYTGIYVASAIFIAFFMAWLGRYPVYKLAPVALLVPLLLFMMFEVWFLVPLPKGPLEAALGY